MMKLKLVHVPSEALDQKKAVNLGDAIEPIVPRFRIGRLKRDCNWPLLSEFVSKRHVELVATASGWSLIDVNSRAGTKLNGARIRPNVAYPVQHGDEFRICGYHFVVVENESESKVGGSDELPVLEGDSAFASVLTKPDRSWGNLTAASAEHKLQLLLDIIRDLRNPTEIELQIRRLIDRLFKLVPKSRRGTVMVKNHPAAKDGFFVTVTRRADLPFSEPGLLQGVIEAVINQQTAVLTDDRRVICVPLIGQNEQTLGCLQLESLSAHELFNERELELVVGAGILVSFAIENDMYFAAVARDRLLQYDLNMAREIQRGLLPLARDRVGAYELFTHYDAALQVGGDYYDVVDLPGGGLAVAVGDVSGKGVPAALLMANISSAIRILLKLGLRPAQVLHRVNQQLVECSVGGNFITLVLVAIDFDTHQIVVANAGHPRPILRLPDGSVTDIGDEQAGQPLGIDADESFDECTLLIPPGASLVLFSDGVTEARAEEGEQFGAGRIRSLLATATAPGTAADVGRRILELVDHFLDDQSHQDDLCLVCVRRTAE